MRSPCREYLPILGKRSRPPPPAKAARPEAVAQIREQMVSLRAVLLPGESKPRAKGADISRCQYGSRPKTAGPPASLADLRYTLRDGRLGFHRRCPRRDSSHRLGWLTASTVESGESTTAFRFRLRFRTRRREPELAGLLLERRRQARVALDAPALLVRDGELVAALSVAELAGA